MGPVQLMPYRLSNAIRSFCWQHLLYFNK